MVFVFVYPCSHIWKLETNHTPGSHSLDTSLIVEHRLKWEAISRCLFYNRTWKVRGRRVLSDHSVQHPRLFHFSNLKLKEGLKIALCPWVCIWQGIYFEIFVSQRILIPQTCWSPGVTEVALHFHMSYRHYVSGKPEVKNKVILPQTKLTWFWGWQQQGIGKLSSGSWHFMWLTKKKSCIIAV